MTNSYCCKVNKVVCIEGDPTHHLLGSIDAVVLIVIVILVINISIKKYMSRFKTNFILDPNKWCVGSPQNILLFWLDPKGQQISHNVARHLSLSAIFVYLPMLSYQSALKCLL